jgi:hypothetical protein
LLNVDPNSNFPEGDAFNQAVIKVLGNDTESRRNYQQFMVDLRKNPT